MLPINMVVTCLQNHVLENHLQVVEVRSARGGASMAMALAMGGWGSGEKVRGEHFGFGAG